MFPIRCSRCGLEATLSADSWRCRCGGAWEPAEQADFSVSRIDLADFSVWRYRHLYGLDLQPEIRLGAGWTPLVPYQWHDRQLHFKLEYLGPTSSFKDRGTEVMVNILSRQGATLVVDDSSGNAGASVAAYAGRAGMRADIFVPAYASPAKQAQIAVYGARVHPIPGPRSEARKAAWYAAEHGAILASHAYHPGFLLGQQSVAWELWEQLGRRAPDWIVVPVGQGVHLLGIWLGFRRLQAANVIDHLPHLVAVQASKLAPIYQAFRAGLEAVPPLEPAGHSVAEGLAIADPIRGDRVLRAIRETDGTCLIVRDEATLRAQRRLAHQGLFVEPTSATVVAALDQLLPQIDPDETLVAPLTGSGLKGEPSG
jgi:threonine synthase